VTRDGRIDRNGTVVVFVTVNRDVGGEKSDEDVEKSDEDVEKSDEDVNGDEEDGDGDEDEDRSGSSIDGNILIYFSHR
jgi:hypothetical protein